MPEIEIMEVDDMVKFKRFLCLGNEDGSYDIEKKIVSRSSAGALVNLMDKGQGVKAVEEIERLSTEGRTTKQEPLMMSLAMCARLGDDKTRNAAYASVPAVCRIPTHIFMFLNYCEELSMGTGWGRAHKRAICNWYNRFDKNPRHLAMLVTKYKNREGWSHVDVLRLCHIKPTTPTIGAICRYLVKGIDTMVEDYGSMEDAAIQEVINYLKSVDAAKHTTDEEEMVKLITTYELNWEHVPTPLLKSKDVCAALILQMPITAMIRHLGKMTNIGVLEEDSDNTELVCQKLQDEEVLQKARIHPVNLLVALRSYSAGHKNKNMLKWNPTKRIEEALEGAFNLSFKYLEPTKQRFCIALDVSGQMKKPVDGSNAMTCTDAALSVIMTILRSGDYCDVVAYSHQLTKTKITKDMGFLEMTNYVKTIPSGCVDISEPINEAQKSGLDYNVFVVLTNSDKACMRLDALRDTLKKYRMVRRIPEARLVVVMLGDEIDRYGDDNDKGMLTMSGFDASGPEVLRNFAVGHI